MSELGDDFDENLEDNGMRLQVIVSGQAAPTDAGYGIIKENRQVTKPFIKEFFREVDLSYNTAIVPGDIVSVPATDEVYIVTNKTPVGFEDAVFKNSCTLYKCNVSGQLKRMTEPDWDAGYHKEPTWQTVRNSCYALMTEALFGNGIDQDEELFRMGMKANEVYVPLNFDPRIEDRFEATSGEYYVIESITKRRFPSIAVLIVNEDTR